MYVGIPQRVRALIRSRRSGDRVTYAVHGPGRLVTTGALPTPAGQVREPRGQWWAGEGALDAFAQVRSAQVDNVLLGGRYHRSIDRQVAARLTEAVRDLRGMVWHNRMFQRRVVHYLLDVGIRQFIDVGCGIPTMDAVHEITAALQPDAKVAYVDTDPVVVELSRMTLTGQPRTVVVQADLRRPYEILDHRRINELLDLGQPVAVLALAVLHHIPDQRAVLEAATAFRDATVAGSFLAVSHLCHQHNRPMMNSLARINTEWGIPLIPRSRQIHRILDGWHLEAPGLTWTASWRPEPHTYPDLGERPYRAGLLGALARHSEPPTSRRP